jgi:hypothetical protein
MSGVSGLRVERIVERLSLAVSLTDEFTGTAAAGRVAVAIGELDVQARRNRSGYYLFTNIPDGTYTVAAASDCYFPALQAVEIPDPASSPAIVDMTLKPGPAYHFPHGATLLRGGVRLASDGAPDGALQGAGVEATALTAASSVKASLAGAAVKGETSISLASISGGIVAGDLLLIRDADRSRQEFVKIASAQGGRRPRGTQAQSFNLAAGLLFNHAQGTELRQLVAGGSALNTTTDERGEFVVYFNQVPADRFMARVRVSHAQYTDVVKEVGAARGDSSSLGLIRLSI